MRPQNEALHSNISYGRSEDPNTTLSMMQLNDSNVRENFRSGGARIGDVDTENNNSYSNSYNNNMNNSNNNVINVDVSYEDHHSRAQYLSFMRSLLMTSSQPQLQSHNHQQQRQRQGLGLGNGTEITPLSPRSPVACNQSNITTLTSHEDNQILDMELVYGDGGEYGSSYSCENLFKDDLSVYCTSRNKNVNILLSHAVKSQAGPVPFVVTGIMIKSPPSGYTSPLKDGLIFISDEPISHESTADFDGFTEEKYRMFMKSKLGKRWGKHSPAIYFKMDQKKPTYIRDLKMPRLGRYILVKLLNSHGKGENIDVQYIGFKGYYGRKSFPAGQLQ